MYNDQLIRQFSLPSSAEGDQRPMVSKVIKPRAIKIKRAVDESDDGDDTESEEFARRSAIIAQANYDDQPTEKKYALNEIEEPELQNLYRLSQNVFDLEARDVKVD